MGIAYSIRYHPRVSKDLSILSQIMKERVKKAIELKLLNSPEVFGIPLQEALRGHRKLRVGYLRIVFQIEPNMIYILAVLHRSFVYKEVLKRL